jgi:prephenate dehydrogenase
MTPLMHDEVFAAVSHLPHLLAFALVAELANRSNPEQLFNYAAGGFRDFTRIAASSPEMWRDISLANKGPLLKELKAYQDQIAYLAAVLEQGDGIALQTLFQQASIARNNWNKNSGN